MSRKPTPSPDVSLRDDYGCVIALLFCSGLMACLAILLNYWLLVFCIPALIIAVAILVYWLYGRLLLLLWMHSSAKRGMRGILVLSDSPKWKGYIEENWLPKLHNQFIILNYSNKKKWEITLPVRLFSHFCGYNENFCPAILLFKSLHHPLVFCFFYAFRDYKHGNDKALKELESRLFSEIKSQK